MIKKILPLLAVMFLTFGAQAQKLTEKIVLKKGDVIKMTTELVSDINQPPQGDMKTNMVMVSELKVTEVTADGYILEATMQNVKMKFDSPFFKDDYDSEDPEKQSGQMAGVFKKVLNKAEKVELGSNGIVVRDEDAKGGMMQMMSGGDVKSTVESAFMTFPSDIKVGKKWRTKVERDGLTTITEYTYKGMVGNMAQLTANQQVKGEIAGGRGGKFTSKVNNLTQMTLMVNPNSGLISMKSMDTKDSSVTEMGGETYNRTGTSKTTITCE